MFGFYKKIYIVIKKILRNIILYLIQSIEKFEYRYLELDENDINKKIIDTIDVSDKNIKVKTDTGWSKITHIHKTQPYKVYHIVTDGGKELYCADNHILFDSFYFNQIFVKDLHIGDSIIVESDPNNIKFGAAETVIIKEEYSQSISMYDLTLDDENHRFYTNGILSHNTIMSAIYMMWYLCFNFDRNVMVVANKAVTMMEIMDKMKVVYQNLPYFLKPGLLENNKSNMKFDNGCRIQGQATSDTPALGFAIHLLYADEFAHIPQNIVEPFYRSIYPTLSSSDISQMIITSTPNGINKFYDIYQGAVKRENDFVPLRTDWWEVPGRDIKWRDREVGNLGSIELFNQEYGNQFLTSDKLLLDNDTRKKMEKIKKDYQHINLHQLDEASIKYDKLKWSPKMMFNDFKKKKDKYVLSIDIADGIGKDYSVINIFRIEPFSLAKIRTLKKYKDESSFFRLRQVGLFHSNDISIDAFGDLISALIFNLFGPDSVSVVLEMNFKGDLILDKLEKHRDFYIELLLHTKHSQNNDYLSPGLKLNRKNKPLLCNEFGHILKNGKIILDENLTFLEASSFGLDKNGNYSSQLGNDDIMMTCINLTSYIDSDNYYTAIEDIVDHYSIDIRNGIQKRLSNIKESDKNDDIDYTFLRDMFNN